MRSLRYLIPILAVAALQFLAHTLQPPQITVSRRGQPAEGRIERRHGSCQQRDDERAVLDARACDCCQTDAAMTSAGPVVVYRNRTEEEIRDIYIARGTAETLVNSIFEGF